MLLSGVVTILLVWPAGDAAAVERAATLGVPALLLKGPIERAPAHPSTLQVFAETAANAADIEKAKQAGFDGVVIAAPEDEKALRPLLAAHKDFIRAVYLTPAQFKWDVAPAQAVVKAGLWPGLQSAAPGEAGATERPWINANLHLYAMLRGLAPTRPAILSYPPDEKTVRYEGAEIAVAEALAGSGGLFLELPEMFRAGIAKADARATAAFKRLAQIVAFHRANIDKPRLAAGARTAIVIDRIDDETEEYFNLTYRVNLSPQVLPAGRLNLAGLGLRVVAAVNMTPSPADATQLRAFLNGGGILITAPPLEGKPTPWWGPARKLRTEPGRQVYSAGRGTLYVYDEAIIDPSAFAAELKDIAGLDNPSGRGLFGLDLRVWMNSMTLGAVYRTPEGRAAYLVSYSAGNRFGEQDFLIGMRGAFASGTALQPERPANPLTFLNYGQRVEWNQSGLNRVGIFSLKELGR